MPSLGLVRQLALLSRDICDRTVEIRRSLKDDHAAYIQNIVGEAVSAAKRHDIRVLYSLVKRLKRQKHPLPSNVRLEDGTMTQTTKQAQERWLRFHAATFSAQEHPVETCTTTRSDLDRDRLVDGFSTEVVRDIPATLAPGKAAGEDLVAMSYSGLEGKIWPLCFLTLFVKSAAACSVPQEWRGGMVRNVHKKCPIDVCSNSRGILTSSCFGKVYGRALRRRLLPAALNDAADTQCGGFPGRSPEFASHCARLFAARCKTRGWSHATVFLDATSAFLLVDETVGAWFQ